MSITQGAAVASIRSRLDEPTSIYWSDTDLRRWINEIASDMARRTEALRGSYDQAVVVGTHEYTPTFASTEMPYRIYQCEFIPDGQTQIYPLEYVDRNVATSIWGLSQAQNEGIPAIWTTWGYPPALTIQIYPSPGQAGDLRIWYYRLPTELEISTNDDTNELVDIVDGWEDVMVDGVEYKAKRRDGDSDWQNAKTEYEQHLEAMMESTIRFTDAAGQITTPSGSFIPSWLYGDGMGW